MTKNRNKKSALPTRISYKELLFIFMSLFSLALIMKNSHIAIRYASEGLRLCAKTVIPTLFPFMVISDVIVSCGASELIGKLLGAPMRAIFKISGDGACAVILGALCGFPLGAKCAVSMYDLGKLSRGELEHLLLFSNVPSPAFLITAVGLSLFGSRSFGILLYCSALAAAFITGILYKLLRKKEKNASRSDLKAYSPTHKKTIARSLTDAITSSALNVLNVCAFVVFFFVFVGSLGCLCDFADIPQSMRAALFGCFELTGGMAQSTMVQPTIHAAIIAAFIAGWSGLSVHFQIMSLCFGRGISFKPYFLAKLSQGAICATLVYAFFCIFPNAIVFDTNTAAQSLHGVGLPYYSAAVIVVFLLALIVFLLKKRR